MTNDFKIGLGFDVHPFAEGRKLILGGVEIPFKRGLAGYSDADVLCHAIGDALLGAAALGDIGDHFPPDDPQWKDANSLKLLTEIEHKVWQARFKVVNVDATLILEKPKIAPYKYQMRKNIAAALKISVDNVSVKATTTEKLGFTGREEGIAAMAAATLRT
ncbi:MAG: 2-C-methyl-D-erythritol 2,4-cyclodiphosphate synthase [candidate division Zixibacteria bacterium]|nr:2-C-methyl-D-erythritol 2,4-cyclodiphosphate synthase [Candidatus Tariuqbacter arcticus]